MTQGKTIMTRTYVPEHDQGVVMANWARHIRTIYPFKAMGKVEFNRHMHEIVEPLVRRAPPLMACEPDHPEQVYGWICAEYQGDLQVLHGVYVRGTWRRSRVGTTLMMFAFNRFGRDPVHHTHPGKSVRHLAKKWRLHFNPYLVRTHEP